MKEPEGRDASPDRTSDLSTPEIVEARALDGYRVWVRFSDGVEGTADVSGLVGKGVFGAWRDPAFFRRLFVDSELGTVAWPGEIDLAPDALYDFAAYGRPLPHHTEGPRP